MHAFEAHFHSDRHQFNQKSRRAASHIELKVAEISVGSSYHGDFQLGTIHKGHLLKRVGRWVHQKEIH